MTKNLTLAIILVTFLALSAPTLAEMDIITYRTTNTFSIATGSSALNLCQCESVADSFVITNTGQFGNQFVITLDKPELASLSQSSFELLPGESETIFMYVNAPCDASYTKKLTLTVTDVFGNWQSFDKTWSVKKCQNLAATLAVQETSDVPCTPHTYELLVNNTGIFTETYEVLFGGEAYEDYFDAPFQELIIPAGGQGLVNSTLTLDCEMSGNHTIPFYIHATNNDLVAELEHTISITPDYGFAVTAEPAQVCAGDEVTIPVSISNTASFENTYHLSLDGPSFLTLEKTNVTIAPNDEKIVFLRATTDIYDADSYKFTFSAIGEIGDFIETTTQELHVNDCYGVSANIELQEPIYDCSGYHEYPVVVKNTGTQEEDVRIDVFGSEYARVDEPNIRIGPNESVDLTLIIDVPPAISLEKDISIEATVLGVDSVIAKDHISVTQLDEQACFEASVTPKRKRISYHDDQVVFTLENTGLGLAAYEVTYDGDEFFALTNESKYANLWPGETATITLLTYQSGPNASAKYEPIIRVFTRSVDGDRVLQYEFPVTISLHARFILLRWYDAAYDYFSQQVCQFVTLVALLCILIAGLIVGLRKQVRRKAVKGLLLTLLITWLILVGVGLYVYGLPAPLYQPINESDDPLMIVMAEDTSYELNLSQYFIDEDGDQLLFEISDMDNVSVMITNETATFTPENDWFGERRFRITAFDGKGGETQSSRLDLEVINRPEYSVWQLYNKYCLYVNLVLILLLFLLVNSLFKRRVIVKQEPAKKKVAVKKTSMTKKTGKKATKKRSKKKQVKKKK